MSCTCEHTINRDGSGQLDRYLHALDPNYAPIDNRGIKELLVYAKRYAGQIRFYDLPEQSIPDGTPESKVSWKEFFRRDVSVIAASIGVVDLVQIKKDYDETREILETNPDADLLSALYNPIIGIAVRLEKWLAITIPTNPLYQDILLAINSSLSIQLQKSKAIVGGYVAVDPGTDLNVDFSNLKNLNLWGLDQPIDPDLSVYEGADEEGKIRNAALYIDNIFLSFYGYLSGLVGRSEGYLLASLEDYPSHQPHMALFITFLKLFTIVQDQMNGITERMLNFYYRDVLQLEEKPSIPDKVHVVFELAKGISEFRIEKETELDGGKDNSGLDQVYQTDDEIIVNEAKVAELKTLFVEKALSPNGMPAINEIYARPVANSLDGYGAPFEDQYPKWDTFGRGRNLNPFPKNICDEIENIKEQFYFNNNAAIGFALASPQLVLQGGNRLIRYGLNGISALLENTTAQGGDIQIKLTAEEGWLTLNKPIAPDVFKKLHGTLAAQKFGGSESATEAGYYVSENQLFIYLPPNEPSIIGYDSEVHQNSFTTSFPVMQILFGPRIAMGEDVFKSLKFDSSSLMVKVGSINTGDNDLQPNMDGLRKLTLQNNLGIIDPDQVFDPFTAYPNMGKSLYIGEDEIFNKPLTALSINVQLAVEPDAIAIPLTHAVAVNDSQFKVNVRAKRQWAPLSQVNSQGFNAGHLTHNILVNNGIPVFLDRKPLTSYDKYTGDTIKGFVEIQLNRAITGSGELTSFQVMQEVAELLKIKALAVSYESTLDRLDPTIDQFYHVYPFGSVEALITQANLNENEYTGQKAIPIDRIKKFNQLDASKDYLLVDTDGQLLPNFSYTNPYEDVDLSSSENEFQRKSNRGRSVKNQSLLKQMALNASGLQDSLGVSINQYSGEAQEEGLLYIGLENLKPLQIVTLLFQFAEGSAEDTDNDPPEIHWSYLSNNEWKPLNEINIISDGTYGFQTTGIVKIDVPADATNNNTIVTTGLHWLRTSVTENSDRIPKLVDVVAQAVVAKFDDRDNDQTHFECPLPAESIGKLVIGKAEVKSVMQPFASWNGKAKEAGKDFYTRVSERLRHKSRAVNAWDYEHLILNRFPSIYKVKAITHTDPNCLCRDAIITNNPNHTALVKYNANGEFIGVENEKINALLDQPKTLMVAITAFDTTGNTAFVTEVANRVKEIFIAEGFAAANITVDVVINGEPLAIAIQLSGTTVAQENCCGPQVSPGHVLVVPISSLKSRNAIDPLRPKTSRRTLLEIEDYLKKRTSPFVRIHAKNPVYEQVMVFFRVKFHFGSDKGFYLKQLNEEIVHYLTPWAFDENAEVKFNQKIYASSIINFIEERDYVDFIKDFFMGVCKDECCAKPDENPREEPVEVPEREDVFEPLDSDAVDTTIITGQILDARTEEPLKGANFFSPDLGIGTVTDANGNFSLDIQSTTSQIAIQMVGYETKLIMVQTNFRWTIYMKKDEIDEVVVVGTRDSNDEDESLEEIFGRFCGCADVEKELTNSDFIGETVINPSTDRSILVSAPKHLIIPCEDEVAPDPCEERRLQKQNEAIPVPDNLASGREILWPSPMTDIPTRVTKKALPKKSTSKTVTSVAKSEKPKLRPPAKVAPVKSMKSKSSPAPKATTAKKTTPARTKKSTPAKSTPRKSVTAKTSGTKAPVKKTVSKSTATKTATSKKLPDNSKPKK
ncbi:MAG: carboxypeptidase-like regulatory domain-containing protein [Saonia sp.]